MPAKEIGSSSPRSGCKGVIGNTQGCSYRGGKAKSCRTLYVMIRTWLLTGVK